MNSDASLLIFAPLHASAFRAAYFTAALPRRLDAVDHHRARLILLCHCFVQSPVGGAGISTCCPSPTTSVLGLGPDLPWADEPSPGILGLSTPMFLAWVSLLIPAFSLPCSPLVLPLQLPPACNAPLPIHTVISDLTLYPCVYLPAFALLRRGDVTPPSSEITVRIPPLRCYVLAPLHLRR